MRLSLALSAVLACGLCGSAFGQPARPPTDVSPVTIYPAGVAPKVVSTFPADGAAIAPGALVLRITFDQQMDKTRFEVSPAASAEAPRCLKTPRLLNDEKTFVLLCSTRGAGTYALTFNGGAAGESGFANMAGQRAAPLALGFTTTSGEPVRTMDDAMKVAGLTGLDVPVQETP